MPGGPSQAQCQRPPYSAPTMARRQTLIFSGVLACSSALARRTIVAVSPPKLAQALIAASGVTYEMSAKLAAFAGARTPLMTAVKSPTQVARFVSPAHAGAFRKARAGGPSCEVRKTPNRTATVSATGTEAAARAPRMRAQPAGCMRVRRRTAGAVLMGGGEASLGGCVPSSA